MVEIRFKPADVGSVADGGITTMDKFPSGVTDPETPADKELFFNTAEYKFKRYETDHWVFIDHLEALAQIADDLLTDAKINSTAAIAKTKLAALNIVNADVDAAAAIAKSKLGALDIVNADVDAVAAIVKSKLAALAIVDDDVSSIGVDKVAGAVDGRAASTTGDKSVTAVGFDSVTEEVVIDRAE